MDAPRLPARELEGLGGLLAAGANVVMQLSHPAVGRGVVESKVESGQLARHPLKRLRTTLTYLAVAMLGSEEERCAYRRALDRVHAAVRSSPESPFAYDAFDRELQLWVAACLYRGAVDVRTLLRGPMDEEAADAFYKGASRLGTTLQVRPEDWPPDRAAFEEYWGSLLPRLSMDEEVRRYLWAVVRLEFLPWPLRAPEARLNEILTGGFLAPRFRELMGMAWTPSDQRSFDLLMGSFAAANRCLPALVRASPLLLPLWDMRLRRLLGRPLL